MSTALWATYMINGQTYPPVVVVDENDHEIGTAMLAEVWQKGLYHRIVSIFIEDDRGRMMFQLRGPSVKMYPNCWDQAAGGHVDAGQSYEQAAINEAAEELGIYNLKITELGTYRSNRQEGGRIISQFERVYRAQVPHDTALQLQSAEVSKLEWLTPDELKKRVAAHPEKFTPGVLYGLRTYFPLLGL